MSGILFKVDIVIKVWYCMTTYYRGYMCKLKFIER